jgi:hypothetical protein
MKINLTFSREKQHFNFIILLFLLFISANSFSQGVAINTTFAPANSSAGLDVDFSNKGFLLSRVALTGTNSALPLSAHVAGMIVYNTATVSDVSPGLYYNNGTRWIASAIKAGTTVGQMLYWNGTTWAAITVGQPGQKLKLNPSGIPVWSN